MYARSVPYCTLVCSFIFDRIRTDTEITNSRIRDDFSLETVRCVCNRDRARTVGTEWNIIESHRSASKTIARRRSELVDILRAAINVNVSRKLVDERVSVPVGGAFAEP